MVDQHDIERFEGEGGMIHMSDGRNIKQTEVKEYERTHPGVHPVQQQGTASGPVTRKLTQGD